MQVECADGGPYSVAVGEGYDFAPNKIVEIMGHLENGETPLSVSYFVSLHVCLVFVFAREFQCHV